MINEEFREISYGNIILRVSNYGRIIGPKKEWSVNTIINKGGYRLIAKAFPEICGEWFDGCEVDHLDTNRENNSAFNLRVCTSKENHNNPLTKIHIKEACNNSGANNPMYGKHRYGENSPFYRKHHSDETKAKIAASKKGKPCSEETKAKLSKPKKKFIWMKPTGELVEMDISNVKRWHPDWVLINE